ncbi:MAG TPA: hypothetical protein VF834_13590 [Streptosporangiaceae bacterium]
MLGPIALVQIAGPRFKGLAWLVVLGGALWFMAPLLCMESSRRAPIIRADSGRVLLTALTATGSRTADLSELASVRLFTMPGSFGPGIIMLIVTDIHGVRIGLTSGKSRDAVRMTLSAQARARTNAARVSRRAARLLYGSAMSIWTDAVLPLAAGTALLGGIVALATFVARG